MNQVSFEIVFKEWLRYAGNEWYARSREVMSQMLLHAVKTRVGTQPRQSDSLIPLGMPRFSSRLLPTSLLSIQSLRGSSDGSRNWFFPPTWQTGIDSHLLAPAPTPMIILGVNQWMGVPPPSSPQVNNRTVTKRNSNVCYLLQFSLNRMKKKERQEMELNKNRKKQEGNGIRNK